MFSANQNIQLRQFKKRVVSYIESTIPEDVLDAGVNVMVMQVTCRQPGCVPLETAVVIIFPPSPTPLLEGLPESAGGSYKTKVLKPMAEVTQEDILDALPPAFAGGRRTMERLCLQARDVMLGQITQLFGDDATDVEGRKLMAEYLQQSLRDYIDAGCQPPNWGEDFPTEEKKSEENNPGVESEGVADSLSTFAPTGNIVLQRPTDDEAEGKEDRSPEASAYRDQLTQSFHRQRRPDVNTVTRRRHQQLASRRLSAIEQNSGALLSRLAEREHAPGVRRAGCPCCDPDGPSNAMDRFMRF